MNILKRIFITAILVLVIDYFMKGIEFKTTGFDLVLKPIMLSVVLGLLNFFVKPILSIFAMPITFMTLGLFSLVINLFILWLATILVPQFVIHTLLAGLLFSVILSLSQSVVFTVVKIK